jgi:hypothetical protein
MFRGYIENMLIEFYNRLKQTKLSFEINNVAGQEVFQHLETNR